MCDISGAISGIGDAVSGAADAVGNLFSSGGAGAAVEGTASETAAEGIASSAAGAGVGDSGSGGFFNNFFSGFGSGGTDANAGGGSTAGPGGISTPSTVPAASAAPSAGLSGGGGTSAAAAAPPGDLGGSVSLGDFKQPDATSLGTGAGKGGLDLTGNAATEFASANPAGTALGQSTAASIPGSTTAPVASGGAAAGSGGNSILNAIKNPSLDTLGTAIGSNAGPLLGGAVLGAESLRSQKLPNQDQLQGSAQNLGTQGQALIDALTTGNLPAGAQQALDQAAADQKAHIRSQYAGMGLSGSTMEQQALAQVDQNAATQKFQQIQQLVQTGLSETQLSNQLYQQLSNAQIQGDAALSSALANFAASLGGGGSTVKLQVAA